MSESILVQGRRRAQFLVGKARVRPMAAAVIKGSPVGWMGALPGTLGGQLWGEGTIEPPSHGSPAIQSRFEVPRSKECPAVTQRRPRVRFDSPAKRVEPSRITRRGCLPGRAARGSAFLRKATCQVLASEHLI